VVLTGRREKEGLEVVAEIKKTGGTAAYIRTDVAKEAEVVKAVDFVLSTHGRLDVAFNNAGVEIVGPLDQVAEEQYRRTFDVNVWGVLNAMKHEVAAMLKTGGGSIVNVSSIAGHIGLAQASILRGYQTCGGRINQSRRGRVCQAGNSRECSCTRGHRY
jgi:NADP-dependent 3-hydroxy acid dehydrogenase YdfG